MLEKPRGWEDQVREILDSDFAKFGGEPREVADHIADMTPEERDEFKQYTENRLARITWASKFIERTYDDYADYIRYNFDLSEWDAYQPRIVTVTPQMREPVAQLIDSQMEYFYYLDEAQIEDSSLF